MIVISDTTAISNLFQVGLIGVLRALYTQIIISPGVYRELSRVPAQAKLLENTKDWIKVEYPRNQQFTSQLLESLDLGEAESIVLAVELKAEYLIIDEKLGRAIATSHGVRITGVLGVLIKAKKEGLIDTVSEPIDRLRELGFWLNEKLVNKVLTALGER